jgi:hypothetical protein
MRWGLIPHWAKDESIGYKMINAKAETITEKHAYLNRIKDILRLSWRNTTVRSKSKKQKKTRDYSIVIALLTLILGGRGIWQGMQIKINKANHEIEIREKIESNIIKLSELSKKLMI